MPADIVVTRTTRGGKDVNRNFRNVPWLELRTATADDPDSEPAVWQAELAGELCRSDLQFFDEAGLALDFPSYFGRNWDAFDECFGDLLDITHGGMGHAFGGRAGRPEGALHVTVHRAEHLLDEGRPEALRVLLEIFREDLSADDRPDSPHAYADFRATFVCAPEELASFRDRLTAAGLRPEDLS
jgi:hypothetical protein